MIDIVGFYKTTMFCFSIISLTPFLCQKHCCNKFFFNWFIFYKLESFDPRSSLSKA